MIGDMIVINYYQQFDAGQNINISHICFNVISVSKVAI